MRNLLAWVALETSGRAGKCAAAVLPLLEFIFRNEYRREAREDDIVPALLTTKWRIPLLSVPILFHVPATEGGHRIALSTFRIARSARIQIQRSTA